MKVNLGSASKLFAGWKNIDTEDVIGWCAKHAPERLPLAEECFENIDIRTFLERTPDNSVEAYAMIHVLDHFTPYHALWILQECKRTLVPGGVLRIEVEDLRVIIEAWTNGTLDQFNADQPTIYASEVNDLKVAFLLFGNLAEPTSDSDYTGHKMVYTELSLTRICHLAGFESIVTASATKTLIEGWQPEWNTQPDHSFFLECVK